MSATPASPCPAQVSTEEDAKHALSISTLNTSAPGSTEAPETAGVAQKLKLLKQITGQADEEDDDEDKEEDAVPQVDSGESWRVVGMKLRYRQCV